MVISDADLSFPEDNRPQFQTPSFQHLLKKGVHQESKGVPKINDEKGHNLGHLAEFKSSKYYDSVRAHFLCLGVFPALWIFVQPEISLLPRNGLPSCQIPASLFCSSEHWLRMGEFTR